VRQVLINGNQAVLARMPRPTVEPGAVLIRVRFSLISTGTELAALRPLASGLAGSSPVETVAVLTNRAAFYLGKAVRNPRKAAQRVKDIAHRELRRRWPASAPAPTAPLAGDGLHWSRESATAFTATASGFSLVSDNSPGSYQLRSQPMAVPAHHGLQVRIAGTLSKASLILGVLDDEEGGWLAQTRLEAGPIDDVLTFDVGHRTRIRLVIANAGALCPAELTMSECSLAWQPPDPSGLPVSEMGDQGWAVGYSAAGEVIAVGAGVNDLVPGDLVACSGAGQANHADYILVRRNLVSRVPDGCPLDVAATTTVGTIALQGVRRAAPQLGETVAVIGLGLIGLITVQLLRAAGCRVIGFDRDAARVARALDNGAIAATANAADFLRQAMDLTGGHGVDQTILTAATQAHGPINLAMEVTRRRGRVVIVGDVGLKPERAQFYRKEIDLLMSTSYGPGRYDRDYEEEGRDYPFAYVRWTLNRNMAGYLQLVAEGRIDVQALIDRVVPIEEAPAVYRELAEARGPLPVGVVFRYPEGDAGEREATTIRLRGHRPPRADTLHYALVGAGAFGTAMLVPQMDRRKDRFFLKAVVSRDPVRGANFARSRQTEVVCTDFASVLADPEIPLMVIATRHFEHAGQVCQALAAGKHVFVEKPLAVSWDQLDAVRDALAAAPDSLLMVGFNRRFAPALAALRQELSRRQEPLVISYRMNAGYIPPDSWIQGPQGAGRNIGEACHIYDLFRSLTGAPVRTVSAVAIDPGDRPLMRSDNFSATLAYADGSLATLTYTALGPKEGLGKERMEVFCGGQAYVLDDFKSLTRVSDGHVLWQSGTADKGHFEELSRFGDEVATGGAAPIPPEDLLETTAVALHIEDLLHGRGEG